MRVWFDISNSPHVNIYRELIRDLQKDHEVVITARPLANTVDLLELHGFDFQVVGKHYGASKLSKAWGYPVRVGQLVRHLRKQRPDVAISHSSFHSPVVAMLLGIPSLYMNDNEHTLGNVPACLTASRVLIPEFLDPATFHRMGAGVDKIDQYPGIKEGFYLCKMAFPTHRSRAASARPVIHVRPEPWTALYYDGAVGFLDDLLLGLSTEADVYLLPRGPEQVERYRDARFRNLTILDRPIPLEKIVEDCSLFIGAGGTMTREMAVLGVPTISVYQSDLLAVDQHLIDDGALVHRPKLTAEEALRFLADARGRKARKGLLEKGHQAYGQVKQTLLALAGDPTDPGPSGHR